MIPEKGLRLVSKDVSKPISHPTVFNSMVHVEVSSS